jgi:hypothetical protein
MTENQAAGSTTRKKGYQKPERIFECSGSVNPESSYYVPLDNVTGAYRRDLKNLVDRGRYISIFAPRQSGKTTLLLRFCEYLHKDRTYIAILLSFQKYRDLSVERFYSQIQSSLYRQLIDRLTLPDRDEPGDIKTVLDRHRLTDHNSLANLFEELNRVIRLKKIVIFIDEFDGIPPDALEPFLNTLRALYLEYKEVEEKALYSVGLVGIRNIARLTVGGVSPFNFADGVSLPGFSLNNVRDLFAQYTEETGQPFSEEAVKMIHEETAGQPWLVNRLGAILTVNIKPATLESVDTNDVKQAVESLLMERNNHFDNLYEKVRSFGETFIKVAFSNIMYNHGSEDHAWLKQHGLIREKKYIALIANNVYKRRYLETFFNQTNVPETVSPPDYLLPGNALDIRQALLDFEDYIARAGVQASDKEKKTYERTVQLLLTAWLYQLVKGGGGELRHEADRGRGRLDIIMTFKGRGYFIVTKVNYGNLTSTISRGMRQFIDKYHKPRFTRKGYLVVFDFNTPLGKKSLPRYRNTEDEGITGIIIGIGKHIGNGKKM